MVPLAMIVFLAECAVIYFCLPLSSEKAAIAGVVSSPDARSNLADKAKGDGSESSSTVEVELGEFSMTAFQPAANATLRIDLHLFGSVDAASEKEFRSVLEENKHRLREQVLMTIRGAEMNELTDPSLTILKRSIIGQAHRLLGKGHLVDLILSDYSLISQ